jgi:sulfate transport system ATP-binding protein
MYVELKGIHKSYGRYKASEEINIQIEKGKLVGLLGPSGSGKTTILRMIAGLEHPDKGDILIDGKRVNDIPSSKRGIGFVFQNYALFRYMSVYENIAFGLKVQGMSKDLIEERVGELINLIGLAGLEKRFPHQLSGGQRQRVAFARALAPRPHLLLLDEPFAAIDAKVRFELRSWLREIIDKIGITSIFVTHDQEEAIEIADEIIVSNLGKIEQKGTPFQLYKQPSTPFVAEFIGNSTAIDNYKCLKGFCDMEHISRAVVRPEHVQIFKRGELKNFYSVAEKGVIEAISFRGSYLELKIKIYHLLLEANRSLDVSQVTVGETVDVLISRIYIFDETKAYLLENEFMKHENYVYI